MGVYTNKHPSFSFCHSDLSSDIVVVVQSLNGVQLFVNPRVATHQASRSFTVSRSLFKLRSIESTMPSNHLILCSPLLLLPSIFVRVFSNESALYIRWPEYWSFIFSISPSNEDSGLISFRIDWFDLIFLNFCFPFTLVENKSCYMCERNLKAVILYLNVLNYYCHIVIIPVITGHFGIIISHTFSLEILTHHIIFSICIVEYLILHFCYQLTQFCSYRINEFSTKIYLMVDLILRFT